MKNVFIFSDGLSNTVKNLMTEGFFLLKMKKEILEEAKVFERVCLSFHMHDQQNHVCYLHEKRLKTKRQEIIQRYYFRPQPLNSRYIEVNFLENFYSKIISNLWRSFSLSKGSGFLSRHWMTVMQELLEILFYPS